MTKLTIDGQEYFDVAEIVAYNAAQGTPISPKTVTWRIGMHQLVPDLRLNGKTPLFKPETVANFFPADRKPGKKKTPSPKGFYSREEVAEALGISQQSIDYYLRVEAITPDYVPQSGKNKGRLFFNQATLDAVKRGGSTD